MFTVTPAPRTRPRPRSLAPLLVVLALASCDALKPAGDDPAPPARPEETPTQPDEQPATAADAKADAASAEELAKTRELLALLNEGRAHVKAKRYAEGVAKYEEALKLDPAHGATMSELGWAAFLSGDLPRAEETLRGALRYVHAPKTRGALLYNLGRVLEELARPDEAARAYAESLEVRPNDVVQKRLASLEAAVKQAADASAAERTRCAFRAWEGVAPARLCETYVAKLEEEGKVEGGGVECESKDLVEREIAVAAGEEPPTDTLETKIALELDSTTRATTFSYHDHELMMETFVLVVDLGKRWFTYEFAHPSHPGVGMADENVEGLSLKAEQLVPGGAKEIVLRWTLAGHDGDMSVNENEFYDAHWLGALSIEGGTPAWLATVQLEQSYGVDLLLDDGEAEAELPHSENFGTKTVKSVSVEWRDGGLVVTQSGKDGASAPTGTFKLGAYPRLCGETWR